MTITLDLKNREVLKIFPGVKERTLISWSEQGLVTCPGNGTGSNREYSQANLVQIALILDLFDLGLSFKKIKSICDSINSKVYG